MNNFIEDLDNIYKTALEGNGLPKGNKDFHIFFPMQVELYGEKNENFLIKKGKFTKFLYTKNGCRVYFSDADVLYMLLQVKDDTVKQQVISCFVNAYNGAREKFRIFFGEIEYEVCGIPQIQCSQILFNLQDIDMSFEDLLVLINLILAKDNAAISLWPKSPAFLKKTLAKYITVLKFFYNHDTIAGKYLEMLGYEIEKDFYQNFKDGSTRISDLKIFEESGIL